MFVVPEDALAIFVILTSLQDVSVPNCVNGPGGNDTIAYETKPKEPLVLQFSIFELLRSPSFATLIQGKAKFELDHRQVKIIDLLDR